MKTGSMLLFQTIGLVLSMLLLGGCESNQLAGCKQEKLQLQKTIEEQQAQIDQLQHSSQLNEEAISHLIVEAFTELEKCKKQVARLKKQIRNAKKPKKLSPEQAEKAKELVAELEAMRQAHLAKRMKGKTTADPNEGQAGQGD